MKKIILGFLFAFLHQAIFCQYILIKRNDPLMSSQKIVNGDKTSFKALSINCIQKDRDVSKYLIYFMIYSDKNGVFNKRKISKDSLKKYKPILLDSAFNKAIINVKHDENREVSFFEYEGNYSQYPIKSNTAKIILESDGNYILYDNITYGYYFEARPYKQFSSVQSCASLINTNSMLQQMARKSDKYSNSIIDYDNIDSQLADYFPNKLFLEKINPDSSYHFAKFPELCKDCTDNEIFEFDYDNTKGITRFWHFLPKKISDEHFYLKFE